MFRRGIFKDSFLLCSARMWSFAQIVLVPSYGQRQTPQENVQSLGNPHLRTVWYDVKPEKEVLPQRLTSL